MTTLEEYQQLSLEWRTVIEKHLDPSILTTLDEYIETERLSAEVFPPRGSVFAALRLCTLAETRVVILGQDPYHGPQQAHGLSFSVSSELMKLPPSLKNIYKERFNDLSIDPSESGDLSAWASQGVLLLNTVLTVRRGEAHSHKRQGWEIFTDAVIHAVSEISPHAVFILWGRPAQKKARLIDQRHTLVESVHPSPLSASRGFFGSAPFSKTNAALIAHQQMPIEW